MAYPNRVEPRRGAVSVVIKVERGSPTPEELAVVVAIDGLEGVRFATARRSALVVLDMSLPGLDAWVWAKHCAPGTEQGCRSWW